MVGERISLYDSSISLFLSPVCMSTEVDVYLVLRLSDF